MEKVGDIAEEQLRIEKRLREINSFTRCVKTTEIQPDEMLEFFSEFKETLNLYKSKRDEVNVPYLTEIDKSLELVTKSKLHLKSSRRSKTSGQELIKHSRSMQSTSSCRLKARYSKRLWFREIR